jgi:hypothetical protein
MKETPNERRERLIKEYNADADNFVNGGGARKTLGFRYDANGGKVFDSFEDYLNG